MPNAWDDAYPGTVTETHEGLGTSSKRNLDNTGLEIVYNMAVDQRAVLDSQWTYELNGGATSKRFGRYRHHIDATNLVLHAVMGGLEGATITLSLHNTADMDGSAIVSANNHWDVFTLDQFYSVDLDISGASLTPGSVYVIRAHIEHDGGGISTYTYGFQVFTTAAS